jgi:hypothetical protein
VNTQISLSYVIGSIIAGIFVLAAVTGIVFGPRLVKRGQRELCHDTIQRRLHQDELKAGGRLLFWGGLATLGTALGIWIGATWPSFDMQYHSYRPVEGTVATVESRLLGGDGSTEMYVVKFVDDATAYRCDDTRCALLHPGSQVRLRCIREWQYAGVSGWRCNYDQVG